MRSGADPSLPRLSRSPVERDHQAPAERQLPGLPANCQSRPGAVIDERCKEQMPENGNVMRSASAVQVGRRF